MTFRIHFSSHHLSQRKYAPDGRYMRKQRDINHSMRTILIDWLVEVGEEYKLNTQTLHLTVNYIDRFLSEVGTGVCAYHCD